MARQSIASGLTPVYVNETTSKETIAGAPVYVNETSGGATTSDNPPFRYGGPIAVVAAILALAQPAPPSHQFFGGKQPYAPRTLSPQITAVPVNEPPYDRRAAETRSTLVVANQPPTWTYTFQGGRQPYEPGKISAGVPGQSVDRPPPRHNGRTPAVLAITVGASQPDPWRYIYEGGVEGRQPYGPRQLAASLPVVPDPPFSHGGRTAAGLAITVGAAQPDPWRYTYQGAVEGRQPYGERQLNPSISAVREDSPPTRLGGPVAIPASIVQATQPATWPYTFDGAGQPYGPERAPILAAVDNPPTGYSEQVASLSAIIASLQPNPWVYSYLGPATGTQPYGPRLLNPTTLDVEVDNPPFSDRPEPDWVRAWWPPDPQPTLRRPLSPGVPGQSVDNPPGQVEQAQLRPPESPQPQPPHLLSPAIPGQSVDNPPPLHRQPDFVPPDPPRPTLAKLLSPGIPGQSVDNPPPSRAQPLTAAAVDPPPTLPKLLSPGIPGQSVDNPLSGRKTPVITPVADPQPTIPRLLSPAIPGQSVDPPPPIERPPQQPFPLYDVWQRPSQDAAIAVESRVPFDLTWLSGVLTSWQAPEALPQLIRPLNSSLTAVQVDNPPFTYGGPIAQTAALVASAQPNPWQYFYLGPVSGLQPYGQRQITPSLAVQADSPPPDSRLAQERAAIVAASLPDPWVYLYGGAQPYSPRLLNPQLTAVQVDNPPGLLRPPLQLAPDQALPQQPRYLPQEATPVLRTDPAAVPLRVWLGSDPPAQIKRLLSPGIPGQSVDAPPVARAQPAFVAAPDLPPTLQRLLSPAIPGQSIDNPPRLYRVPIVAAPPDPPPQLPRLLSPGIPGQSVDPPPVTRAQASYLAPPDPQPTLPKLLSPAIPGQSIDQPPRLRVLYQAQPDQYWPTQRPISVPQGQTVDNPPFTYGGPVVAQLELAGLAQPALWTFSYQGGGQPYAPIRLSPDVIAATVDNPPFDKRASELRAELVSLWQPDPDTPPPELPEHGIPVSGPEPVSEAPPPGGGDPPKKKKPVRPIWDRVRDVAPAPAPVEVKPAKPEPAPVAIEKQQPSITIAGGLDAVLAPPVITAPDQPKPVGSKKHRAKAKLVEDGDHSFVVTEASDHSVAGLSSIASATLDLAEQDDRVRALGLAVSSAQLNQHEASDRAVAFVSVVHDGHALSVVHENADTVKAKAFADDDDEVEALLSLDEI